MSDGQFMELKLSQVVPGKNYRKHYDKQAMKELAASIRDQGVIQPVIVRKVGKTYELVVGWRRWFASGQVKKPTIPALVRTLTDEQVREIQAIENIQREDPNPMDEAIAFKELLDLGKHTVESLALRFRRGQSYVYSRLRLLDLDKSCQKALLSGDIDLGHATALLRIGDKGEQKAMLESIIEQDMSPTQARDAVRQDYGQDLRGCIFSIEACHKCERLSSVQGKLFSDVIEEGDDRCMDEKCFRTRTIEALDLLAAEYAGNWLVVKDLDGGKEVEALRRKGASFFVRPEEMKPKCKKCHERAFWYGDDRGMIRWGWQCPKKKCYDETVHGIKPREKQPSSSGGEESGITGTALATTEPKELDYPFWEDNNGFAERVQAAKDDSAFWHWAISMQVDMTEHMYLVAMHAAWNASRQSEKIEAMGSEVPAEEPTV